MDWGRNERNHRSQKGYEDAYRRHHSCMERWKWRIRIVTTQGASRKGQDYPTLTLHRKFSGRFCALVQMKTCCRHAGDCAYAFSLMASKLTAARGDDCRGSRNGSCTSLLAQGHVLLPRQPRQRRRPCWLHCTTLYPIPL